MLKETQFACCKCGGSEHKAMDCPTTKGSAVRHCQESSFERKISCYACGDSGHKSPPCPEKQLKSIK